MLDILIVDGALCCSVGLATAERWGSLASRPAAAMTELTAAVRPQAIAVELAQDEAKHVAWLQAQLGIAAIPMPQVWMSRGRFTH